MEGKRIRLIFRDNDILNHTQKSEGLTRTWVLLKPHHHDAVSDLASHLLHAFHLHQSCPHGLLLSFESTHILKDNEIISVRKRKDLLSIEGNDVANDIRKLKALGKQPVNSDLLLLTYEEFEKEKGDYESDEPEEESEDDDDDGSLLEVVDNSSGANANIRNCKRKATERLQGYKEKKQRSKAKHSGNTSGDICFEKKYGSIAGDNMENRYEAAKHNDTNIVSGDGKRRKKKRSEAKHRGNTSSDVCNEKTDGSINEDNVENRDEPANVVKRTVDVQEKDKVTDDTKIYPEETTKVASRSARRQYAKRRLLREMVKIQQQNAICVSEGLQNWKEDQAKVDRKKLDRQWKGQQKRKNNHADAERNKADDQPKGLLHWKLSSQNNGLVNGKRHKQHYQNDDFIELPNRTGYLHKQHNQKGDKGEHLIQIGDISGQPKQNLNEQPGQNGASVQEPINQNSVASEKSNHTRAEENEILPIVVRPGHIRFKPLDEEEYTVQQDHARQETFNWNGITSKKKGQQWGKENHRFTPRNDYKRKNKDSDALTKEKEKQANEGIHFDKLPPLPGTPKKGDLIAYRILELSSTWTPELSAHRVGKVSWYNTEFNQIMLLPVPEYPIFSEKDDEDIAVQPDNSLYKEDGSLETDFLSLIDVRVLTNGRSEQGNEAISHVSEASTGNANALKSALPGSCDKPTAEASPDTLEPNQVQAPTTVVVEAIGGSIWDQLSEALNAKKEQLSKENGWGNTPNKVLVLRKPQPSPGTDYGKKARKPQENSWGKQSAGSNSWSCKSLRGIALGPTVAMLRSKNDA